MTTKEHINALEDERKALISHIEELQSDPERHYIRLRETIQHEREWRQKAEARAANLAIAKKVADAALRYFDLDTDNAEWDSKAFCALDDVVCEYRVTLNPEAREEGAPALNQLDIAMAELCARLREHFEADGHPTCPDPECDYVAYENTEHATDCAYAKYIQAQDFAIAVRQSALSQSEGGEE